FLIWQVGPQAQLSSLLGGWVAHRKRKRTMRRVGVIGRDVRFRAKRPTRLARPPPRLSLWRASALPSSRGRDKKLPLPRRHARDLRAERVQPFLDALIAALDLVGIVDRA